MQQTHAVFGELGSSLWFWALLVLNCLNPVDLCFGLGLEFCLLLAHFDMLNQANHLDSRALLTIRCRTAWKYKTGCKQTTPMTTTTVSNMNMKRQTLISSIALVGHCIFCKL